MRRRKTFLDRARVFGVGTLWLAIVTLCAPHARGATPYEAQIGGFIYAALQTFITGEFAGRSPSNAQALNLRPICKPADYDDLRAAANDRGAFDAFHRRCHLLEEKLDATHVHMTAYLPASYCETLKAAFEKMMVEVVRAEPPANIHPDDVIFEYKGSRYQGTRRALARGARLQVACQLDGSLRVSAPRQRRSR